MAIMSQFPFDSHNISLLTLERPSPQLQRRLRSAGLRLLCFHGRYGDGLWIHESVELPAAARNVTFSEKQWCPAIPEEGGVSEKHRSPR